MGENPSLTLRLWGGVALVLALISDQAHKFWMLYVFDIGAQGRVALAPFFDLVLTWNKGVSYSLFEAQSDMGRYILLAVSVVACLVLAFWLWRATKLVMAVGLGLVIGGALGNAYDRWAYGAVADFFYFHLGSFSWYIFNLADVWIVAGAGLLLYDGLVAKQPHDHVQS
jgi:signal peptidase II